MAAWPSEKAEDTALPLLSPKVWARWLSFCITVPLYRKYLKENIKFKSLLGRNSWLSAGCKQSSPVCLIRKWKAALTCFPAVEWPSWMFSVIIAMLMLVQIYTLYPIQIVPKVHNLHFQDLFEWFSATSSCLLSVFTDHSLWGSWDTLLRKCTPLKLLQFKQ